MHCLLYYSIELCLYESWVVTPRHRRLLLPEEGTDNVEPFDAGNLDTRWQRINSETSQASLLTGGRDSRGDS
jgi:hypothetical protein